MNKERRRIGRYTDLATRHIVYMTAQGIEVDELDHFEIIRKRVLYEDVLLVTYHREPSRGYVVFMGLAFVFFVAMATLTASSVPALAGTFAVVAVVTLVFGTMRLMMQSDVVSVFGRRSKASLRFAYRKAYARQLYGQICANAAAAQRRLARDIAATEPAEQSSGAAEAMPPMPEEPPTVSSPPPAQ